jgi:hypothetical protein
MRMLVQICQTLDKVPTEVRSCLAFRQQPMQRTHMLAQPCRMRTPH